jgi:uncharacterized protein YggL (DUF469 family)
MKYDYQIKFKFACEQTTDTTDPLIDQFVATVERAQSYAGGGCDQRDGEFFIETGEKFKHKDLLTVLSVWLPHVKQLSVKAVAKTMPSKQKAKLRTARG